MPKIYAFDVDETLFCSNGPVTLEMMDELRRQGHVVGLCGNWACFVQRVPNWQEHVSFINAGQIMFEYQGQVYGDKAYFLQCLRQYIPAEEVVMVGNIFGEKNSLGFVCGSHDSEQAAKAGVRFIREDDFARGVR